MLTGIKRQLMHYSSLTPSYWTCYIEIIINIDRLLNNRVNMVTFPNAYKNVYLHSQPTIWHFGIIFTVLNVIHMPTGCQIIFRSLLYKARTRHIKFFCVTYNSVYVRMFNFFFRFGWRNFGFRWRQWAWVSTIVHIYTRLHYYETYFMIFYSFFFFI